MNDQILASWEENAQEWIKTISEASIPSRTFTNPAIVKAIRDTKAKYVVDIGCGEGWLTRELSKINIKAVGLDAINELLKQARKKGAQDYFQLTFEDIINGKTIPGQPFDAAVYNFCLYQKDDIDILFQNTFLNLKSGGTIVVQTLHPYFLRQQGLNNTSQWISDSWKGLSGNFTNGHHWYCRTKEDWISIIKKSGAGQIDMKEVLNDEKMPLSVIFTFRKV